MRLFHQRHRPSSMGAVAIDVQRLRASELLLVGNEAGTCRTRAFQDPYLCRGRASLVHDPFNMDIKAESVYFFRMATRSAKTLRENAPETLFLGPET